MREVTALENKMWDVAYSRDKEKFAELAGTFHIASMWRKGNGKWRLIFNMDSRTGEIR